MKSLKKISLESISETLSDNELKSITGGYSCWYNSCYTEVLCNCGLQEYGNGRDWYLQETFEWHCAGSYPYWCDCDFNTMRPCQPPSFPEPPL